MKSRAVVSLALAAAVGLGLSACNYFAPQGTTDQYAASDGVNANAGDFELRNLLVIAADPHLGAGQATPAAGAPSTAAGATATPASVATLSGAVVNHTGKAGTVTVSYEGGSVRIPLPADESLVQLSFGDGSPVELSGGSFTPGQDLEMTFTPSSGASTTVAVPVLDGTLREYSTLVPTPTTPLESASPAPTAPGEGQETPAP